MQHDNVESEIRTFVTTNFLYGQDLHLEPGDSLLDKGVIDSTGVLELVAFLESQFSITIGDEDVIPENLDSIRNLTAFVTRKIGCPV